MSSVVEIRIYKTKSGQRSSFLDILQKKGIAAHEALGIKIVGPFPVIEDDDTFCWMLIFPDEPARDLMKQQFYAGKTWNDELKVILRPMLESNEMISVRDVCDVFLSLPNTRAL
jgi:hypothetical protein